MSYSDGHSLMIVLFIFTVASANVLILFILQFAFMLLLFDPICFFVQLFFIPHSAFFMISVTSLFVDQYI